jgi:hypothetical protein
MVAPNIVSATSVRGQTKLVALCATSSTILFNSAGSNMLYKISTLLVANRSENSAAVTVTVAESTSSSSSSSSSACGDSRVATLAHEIVVPPNSTLVIVNRNTPIYLQEQFSITAAASAPNALDVICAYEEII